jgi:dTDP-4-dehydrorhamnose reductase
MKILITGSGGMLGSSMIPVLQGEGHEVHATDKNISDGIEFLDVRKYDQVLQWASRLTPDFIFHLAAETDIEICENDPQYAYATNTIGTQNVALVCKKLGIKMVYICTAGIFDGKKESFYNEFDEAVPLSVYGKTKLEGEKIVRSLLHEYFVCRPGWMVGGGDKDKKFVGQILKQIRDGAKDLYAVDDKFGTSTYTKDFCKNLSQLMKTDYYGLYHMVSKGSASRYDVAKEIVKILNRPDITVHSVHSDHFAKRYPVNRPRSEMLDNMMLDLRDLNLMRNWREILPEYISENFSDMIMPNHKNMTTTESKNKKKFIVIGAGLAGLSTAYKLLQQGAEVTILEKAKEIGGLARTIKYKDYDFDFSAHRFSASKKDLIEEMKQIMEGNFTVRSKRSRILMWGKWLNYPFELLDLMLRMPKLLAIRAVADYLFTTVKEKIRPSKIVSFKDWFVASFGHTLYKTNCEPYATKHWRINPSQISSEWGQARSPASFNLKTIIKDLITKKYSNELGEDNPYPDADSFYYPKTGGVGSIANRFADEIRNMGGKIYTESEITKIDLSGDKAVVEFNKYGSSQRLEADKIVSTISVYILSNLVTPAVPEDIKDRLSKLKYLNTIFINVIINRPKISDDSWLYFPQPSNEIIFNRAVEFKNWSEDMAPSDKTSLCLDISCTSDEKIWTEDNDAQLIAKAKEGLVRSKIIDSEDEVEEAFVLKIPFTYPVYDLDYVDNLRPVVESLEKNDKLRLVGRIGKFSYSNMDDVIYDGFALANDLMK